jgi:hypothetical protein
LRHARKTDEDYSLKTVHEVALGLRFQELLG